MGIQINTGTHVLENVLLYKNRARRGGTGSSYAYGGGLYIASGATVAIRNATLYGHVNYAIYNASAHTMIENCILYQNLPDLGGTVPALSRTLTGDGVQAGVDGNLSGDPMFDEEGCYLLPDSPGVGSGTGTVTEAGLTGYTTQTDGTPDAGIVDMGYHHPDGLPDYETFYVSGSGSDAADGAGWSTALRSIGKALELGGARVRVRLGSGEYTPATETFPFALAYRTLQVIGANAAAARIDAGATALAFDFADAWGANRLEQVTVTGGKNRSGGGGAIRATRSALSLDGCIVTNNQNNAQHAAGAGLYAELAEVRAANCAFDGNTSTAG